MAAAIQFKFPSISVTFAHERHARSQTDSLRVMGALTEKRHSRKEIAGLRHENFPPVTFMQQFYDALTQRA